VDPPGLYRRDKSPIEGGGKKIIFWKTTKNNRAEMGKDAGDRQSVSAVAEVCPFGCNS
jgi:hypothetical protein